MRMHFISITVAAGVLLTATRTGWARVPRTHSLSGVVEAIDCSSRTIMLKPKDGAAPLTFVWKGRTRFSREDGCARCSLDFGQTVRVSYRRELGQNVLREVSAKSGSAGCGAVCK